MSKTRMYRNAGARYLVDYFSFAAKQCSFRSHHTSGHHHASGVRRRVDSSTIKKWLVNKFAFNKDHDCFSHEKKRHRYLGAGRRADCVLAGILFVMGAALIPWMAILLFTMPFPGVLDWIALDCAEIAALWTSAWWVLKRRPHAAAGLWGVAALLLADAIADVTTSFPNIGSAVVTIPVELFVSGWATWCAYAWGKSV